MIELIHGNCIAEMKHLGSKTVDLIIADPPYNVGKNYGNNTDKLSTESYLSFLKEWLTECRRVLKDDGTIYVFAGFRYISYVYQILEDELKMNFVNWISWHYTQGIGKTKGFSPRHDDILMFSKTKKYKFNLDAVRVPQKYYRKVNNMRGANPGDVWAISHVHYCQKNRQQHPTQKPEAIIERMIKASSDEHDLVLDPFGGSGTTARVCQQLKRNCISIELNEHYICMTRERLSEPFTGFDSIDERLLRVPNDLNDISVRAEYVKNHIQWFLSNNEDKISDFIVAVNKKYGVDRVPQQCELELD